MWPSILMNQEQLKERISQATSNQEIDRLLELGKTFTSASKRTQSKWRNAAARRRKELAG